MGTGRAGHFGLQQLLHVRAHRKETESLSSSLGMVSKERMEDSKCENRACGGELVSQDEPFISMSP